MQFDWGASFSHGLVKTHQLEMFFPLFLSFFLSDSLD